MKLNYYIYDSKWKKVNRETFERWNGTKGYGPNTFHMIMIDENGSETDMFAFCQNILCHSMNVNKGYIMPCV